MTLNEFIEQLQGFQEKLGAHEVLFSMDFVNGQQPHYHWDNLHDDMSITLEAGRQQAPEKEYYGG